jgi:hypothetical protein
MARPQCVYCGAALPEAVVLEARARARESRAQPPADSRPEGPDRALVILDLAGASIETVQKALGLSRFEADQRARQGGFQLLRIASPAEAQDEAALLSELGLAALVVPESEVRAAHPVLVRGGRQGASGLTLRAEDDLAEVPPDDVLLVVRGPITREYQAEPSTRHRRNDVALEGGHRIHLHRRSAARPLELDPSSFEFDDGGLDSSLRRLTEWVTAIVDPATIDEGFRLLTPALAPAEAESLGSLAGAEALRRRPSPKRSKDGGRMVLDNVSQFRFYSAWRAAVERLRGSR